MVLSSFRRLGRRTQTKFNHQICPDYYINYYMNSRLMKVWPDMRGRVGWCHPDR